MQKSSLILNTVMQIPSFAHAHKSGRARLWPPMRVCINPELRAEGCLRVHQCSPSVSPALSATEVRGGDESFNLATKFDKQRLVFMAKLREKLVKEWGAGGARMERK